MNMTVDADGRVLEPRSCAPPARRCSTGAPSPSSRRGAVRPLLDGHAQKADQLVITSRFRFTREESLETTLSATP